MAEIINLSKYRKERDEKELDDLAQQVADVIEELGLPAEFDMYTDDQNGYIYGMPYIYTITPPSNMKSVETLSDVTDILTSLCIRLDGMGYNKWAGQLSEVVGEMFLSGTFREG